MLKKKQRIKYKETCAGLSLIMSISKRVQKELKNSEEF